MRQSINFGKWYTIQTADLLSYLFLLLLPPIFFWRETLGWFTLGDADILFWFFPVWKLAVEQIKGGQLPLWNPYLYSGTPLFAVLIPGLLDPLNWIHILGPTSRTLTMAQEASFSVALLGMFSFTRRLGLLRRACVISAVIYALSGYAVARTIYPGLFHILALMPVILWLIERLYQMGRWRDVILGGVIVAWQILAAHPQPFVYSSLLVAAYVLFCAFLRRDDQNSAITNLKFPLGFLAKSALVFIIGIALSSVQLLPAWEVASQSVRQQVPYGFFTWHSIHPITLLTTIIPFFHGQGRNIYHLPYWGAYWHHNEAQFYLGITAISLALAGALCLWRERSRVVLFWIVIVVIAVVLSLGKYVGPVAWLVYQIPMLNQFRSPNRHWMEVTMAVSVLAGYAVNHTLRYEERAITRVAQIVAPALTLITVGVGAFILWRRDLAESIIRRLPDMNFLPRGFLQQADVEFYFPALSAVCLLVILIIYLRQRERGRWYFVLLASVILDFHLYAAFAPINNPHKLESLAGKSMPTELAAKQSERAPIRYHLMLKPAEGVFNPYWFYGYEMATGYDPMMNQRYLSFSGINEAGRSTLPTLLDGRDRTLDLLNVNYVLVPAPMLEASGVEGEQAKYGGITFSNDHFSQVDLRAGQRANYYAGAAAGDTLAVVSMMTNSAEVADGDEVGEILVGCESGERATLMLVAGRDTAEWAHDRSDVHSQVNHSRAPLAASWPGDEAGSFQAHTYLARLPLPASVARCNTARYVQVTSRAKGSITININQISLYDSASGLSTPVVKTIGGSLRDTTRWREVSVKSPDFGYRDLRVFENLRALPRVWIVNSVEVKNDDDQIRLIRGEPIEGQERIFEPLEVALIDLATASKLDRILLESAEKRVNSASSEVTGGTANIIKREPARMVIAAEATRPSLLVISEVAFPGWRAKIDGREVELLRVNYLLRGLALAPGNHTVEVFYWPRSLVIGAMISLATLISLATVFMAITYPNVQERIRNKRK